MVYSCAAYALEIDKDPAQVQQILRKLLASRYGSAEMMAMSAELEGKCTAIELPEELQLPPLILERFICEEEEDNSWSSTQAYIARSQDQSTVVMACMGTEIHSLDDWVTNSRGAWSRWRPFHDDPAECCKRTAECAVRLLLHCCTDLLQCGPSVSEFPYVHMGFYDGVSPSPPQLCCNLTWVAAFKPLRVHIDEHLVPLAMRKETREIVITGHRCLLLFPLSSVVTFTWVAVWVVHWRTCAWPTSL